MKPATATLLCTAGILLYACKTQNGHPLSLSDAYAYAPVTPSAPGVAYFTLSNQGAAMTTAHAFASDCFARAELHASTIESGVSKMRPVASLDIGPARSVALQPGGLHLMLLSPTKNVSPGSACKLRVKFTDDTELETTVELLDRTIYRPAEPVK